MNDALEPPRHTYLGASEIAAALGLSTHETSLDVWARKTGRRKPDPDNGDTLRGRFLEPVVRQFCVAKDPRVDQVFEPRGFLQAPDNPYTAAHDDGALLGFGRSKRGTLEIKNPRNYPTFQTIRDQGLPSEYVVQLNQTTGLAGDSWGAFAVHCADSWETLIFAMEFDPEVFAWFQHQGELWFKRFVETDTPPPMIAVDTFPELPVLRGEASYREDDEWAALMSDWEVLRQTKKQCEEMWEPKDGSPGMKHRVLELMGEERVVIGGGYKTTRVQNSGKLTLSKEAIEALGPLDPTAVAKVVSQELTACGLPARAAEGMVAQLLLEARLSADDPRLYKRSAPFEYPLATPLKGG